MERDHIPLPRELTDYITDFLHDSPSDLKACALVSRAFVEAAQFHIFKELTIGRGNDGPWSRVQGTLNASPHLIRHIRRLELHPRRMSIETLASVCSFPFTHLKEISSFNFTLSLPSAIAFQQLLALPSLRSVGIMCRFEEPPTFLHIWDRCSPNIKHLHLTSFQTSREAFQVTAHHCSAPIRLESLRITAVEGVRDWVNHPLCPFDFSGITALSIFIYTEVVRWPKFAPVLRTLKVLDFSVYASEPPIDLSPFLNLALLRIFLYSAQAWPNAFDALATIAPTNRIRKIVIYGAIAGADPEELDAKLSALPLHQLPAVEFQMAPAYFAQLAPALNRLNSRNMVYFADSDPDWFERVTRAL
ncbi:hypothetical protein FB451DRAFT_1550837 [Mycena latifolia]|nr:hypothetical protein FB451DRAFT_1550837 [Mycena latifolia]